MARPKPILTEEQIEDLEKMAGVGLTIDQMAPLLGISSRTLERIKERNKQVSGAIEKGRSKAIFAVGKSAYQQALSGKTPAMMMFWLKCRAGWKETQVHQVSGPDGGPVETLERKETPEEMQERRKRLRQKAKMLDILDDSQ